MAGFFRAESFRKAKAAVAPDLEVVNFSRVRSADSGHANGASVTANWGATPAQGDLLLAIACHRSGESAIPAIDGSNWFRRIDRFVGLDNTNDRRAMIIWAKIAGASEPQYVTVNWASSVGTRLVLQQFHADKPYGFSGLGNRSANSATGSTGNTAATMAGTIPPLVIPDGPDVYTGFSDKQSILRISVMTARAGATGPNGPAFANVGNLVEFTSAGTFQNALAVGFGAVHTELFGARLNDTLTWDSDVLQPCAAHLVFGGVTSYNPL